MSVCDCQDCRDVREAEMLNEVRMRVWIDDDGGMHLERMKLHDSPVTCSQETE